MDGTLHKIKKYFVKSGYQVERVYSDKEKSLVVFRPIVDLFRHIAKKFAFHKKINIFYGRWCQSVYQ